MREVTNARLAAIVSRKVRKWPPLLPLPSLEFTRQCALLVDMQHETVMMGLQVSPERQAHATWLRETICKQRQDYESVE